MGTSGGGNIAINERKKMFISPQPGIAFALATSSSSVNGGAIRGLCAGRINSLNSMPSGWGEVSHSDSEGWQLIGQSPLPCTKYLHLGKRKKCNDCRNYHFSIHQKKVIFGYLHVV